jgi:hypothetical protein
MADSATRAAVPAPIPCKITPLAAGGFQANAVDMPLNCKLSTPDGKTQILTVNVFDAADGSKVAGQPSSQTTTSFSVALPKGTYNVAVIMGFLPNAVPVKIVESCAAQTELVDINVPASNNGQFDLVVV